MNLSEFGDLVQRSLVNLQSTFSKDFSSETFGRISIKFRTQVLDKGGKKVYIFGPVQMAAMPIYDIYIYIYICM